MTVTEAMFFILPRHPEQATNALHSATKSVPDKRRDPNLMVSGCMEFNYTVSWQTVHSDRALRFWFLEPRSPQSSYLNAVCKGLSEPQIQL